MNLITRDELRQKLERGDEFKLLMTMSATAYRAKHIPSSEHFDSTEDAMAALDPGEEIVVYCADIHCAASIYAYRTFEREGYPRVRRYAGGVSDWEAAGYRLERSATERTDGTRATPARAVPRAAAALS